MVVIKDFYDKGTGTYTYVVSCPQTKKALIIDPVWGFDLETNSFSDDGFREVCDYITGESLKPTHVFETHVHADHISASQLFKHKYQIQTLIHENVKQVCKSFDVDFSASAFDHLLSDQEIFKVGELRCKVIHTPGHTPACVSLLVDDKALFVGDTVFMPDFGSGRCDFPGGSAITLFESVTNKLYTLPHQTKVYVGHDYGPGGRPVKCQTSIEELSSSNKHLKDGTHQNDFVQMRLERDKKLNEPKLLKISMQYNLRGGSLSH